MNSGGAGGTVDVTTSESSAASILQTHESRLTGFLAAARVASNARPPKLKEAYAALQVPATSTALRFTSTLTGSSMGRGQIGRAHV